MAQTTWAADSTTWSANTNVWANQTFTDSVTLASTQTSSNTGTAILPSSVTFGTDVTYSPLGGFSFSCSIVLGATSDTSTSNSTLQPVSITLASTGDISPTGSGKLYVDSITLGSTVDFPLPGMSTGWDEKATTWASDTTSWGYIPNLSMSVSANMTQLNLTELNEEDAVKLASVILGTSVGTTASASVSIPVSISLAETSNITTNINFEESITLSAIGNLTSVNNFLWNDVTEDTSTTWTKVADPDE
jgi:hypothetical protein